MHESPEEVAELQALLDRSYAAAGEHLLSIHTDNWKLDAQGVIDRLTGMCVLTLATVNSKGEPIAGPVDGMFYRGRFWCGSAPTSLRARHIRANPAVSVTHTVGEELAVTVHGKALVVDRAGERAPGFRDYLNEIYGGQAMEWTDDVVYWEIEPRKMFALAPQV